MYTSAIPSGTAAYPTTWGELQRSRAAGTTPPGRNTQPGPHKRSIMHVYYLPAKDEIPLQSIIREQLEDPKGYAHPVLVYDLKGNKACFYQITTTADRFGLSMEISNTREDLGPNVLTLSPQSAALIRPSFVKLGERFEIEGHYLNDWKDGEVILDSSSITKIQNKVTALEAAQNRPVYRPLPRNLSKIATGTILFLPSKLDGVAGGPVVVLEKTDTHFRYLRLTAFADSTLWKDHQGKGKASWIARRACIAIDTDGGWDSADGTLTVTTTKDSPALRSETFIQFRAEWKWVPMGACITWCWPPIVVTPESVKAVLEYCPEHAKKCPGDCKTVKGREDDRRKRAAKARAED